MSLAPAAETERAVLGALLLDPSRLDELDAELRAEDFGIEKHRAVFEAMRSLRGRGLGVDLVALHNELKARGKVDLAGGGAYLSELSDAVVSAALLDQHVSELRKASLVRHLASSAEEVLEAAKQPGADPDELLDAFTKAAYAVAERRTGAVMADGQAVMGEVLGQIERFATAGAEALGIQTHFRDLDRTILGLRPGSLTILAGRPSMGKTALALNVGWRAAERKIPVLFFSLEQSQAELGFRLLSILTRMPSETLQTLGKDDRRWPAVVKAADRVVQSGLLIDDQAGRDIWGVRAVARREFARRGRGLLILDYLQLMAGRGRSREEEVAGLSRSLKALARELNCPILALSQLNREVEKRPAGERKPRLSDLRESGSLEQDADLVLLLHRPSVYSGKAEDRHLAEVIVAKNRNGPTRTLSLFYDGRFTLFGDSTPDRPGAE